jgi:hypothetical protein
VAEREFTSPLTGDKFVAAVISGRPPVANYDYDQCPHSLFNALAYALVTDPATGWTNYPDLYAERCPLTAEKLASVLGQPKFDRQAPAGLPWLNAYPWEQFENAALQSAAVGQSALQTGNWFMEAAWAVRLEVAAGGDAQEELTALFQPLPRPRADPAQLYVPYELQFARALEQQRAGGVLKGMPDADSALALAWLYRSRGELAATTYWLDIAAASAPALGQGGSPHAGLYSSLRNSGELERGYLKQAQSWLKQGWEAGGSSRRKGRAALALGEIARRLGDLAAARNWYREAARNQQGDLDPGRLQHLDTLAAGRGY